MRYSAAPPKPQPVPMMAQNGDHLGRRAPEEAGLFGVLGFLRRGDAAGGLIVVGRQVAVAAVVVLIFMEAVKIIVIHRDSSFIFGAFCISFTLFSGGDVISFILIIIIYSFLNSTFKICGKTLNFL